MSSKEAENKSEVERTYVSSGNILKGMNESSNPGYIHYADIDASYDIQHKTRRRGELFTLSYMLALTRQRTEQENSCSLQRSFLSEDRLTVRISANDLFRNYKGKIENDLHTYIKVLKSIIYTIFSELLNLHKTYTKTT